MSASTILRRPAFWVCAALGLLASCIDDFADSSARPGFSEGEREVIIKLEVPQQVMPPAPDGGSTTRTVETPEINDLYILAFQATGKFLNNVAQEPYLYYVKAEKGSGGKWTANLKAANYQQTFVMLANTKSTATETGGHTYDLTAQLKKALESANGKNKTEVLKDLYVSLEGEIDPDGELPLCGQMAGQTIEKPATPDAATPEISVTLQRMVARLNLYIKADGSGMDKFKLTRIYVYNPRQKGMVASAQLSPAGAAAITQPTLPLAEEGKYEAPDEKLLYDVTDGTTKVENTIYLFENGQPDQYPIVGTDQNSDLGLLRPCLIIGGIYNNEQTEKYWRVDFIDDATKAPMNILRNYTYNVTLTAVEDGTGTTDPEDALKTGRPTISASIIAWNDESMGGVSFGENNFLGLGKVAYTYGQGGSPYGTQTVMATPELEWTAHLVTDKEVEPSQAQAPGWIKFMQTAEEGQEGQLTDVITGIGQGLNNPETLNFYVEEYYDETPRTAYMVFTAGNLEKLTCTITQTNERLLEIVVLGGEVMQFTDNGSLMRQLNVSVTPTSDTKLTWYYSKGTFKNVHGSLTGEKRFNSTNTISFGDQYAGTEISVDPLEEGQTPKGFLYLTLTDLKEPTKTVSKAIPMEQLEFWLQFNTPSVILPDDGSNIALNIESNFQWKFEEFTSNAENETDANELIFSPTTGQTGTGSADETSVLNLTPKTFSKVLAEYKKSAKATFRFIEASGLNIEKTAELELTRALKASDWQGDKYYRIHKSEEALTHWTYNYDSEVDGVPVITMDQANNINEFISQNNGGWADEKHALFYTKNPIYWMTPNADICRTLAKMYPDEEIWGGNLYVSAQSQVNLAEKGEYYTVMNLFTFKGNSIFTYPIVQVARLTDDTKYSWITFNWQGYSPRLNFSVYADGKTSNAIDFLGDVSYIKTETNKGYGHDATYYTPQYPDSWYTDYTPRGNFFVESNAYYKSWKYRSGLNSGIEATEYNSNYKMRLVEEKETGVNKKCYGFFIQEIKE